MIPGDHSFLNDHDLLSIDRSEFLFHGCCLLPARRSKLEYVRYDWPEAGFLLDVYTIKRSIGFNVSRSKVPRRGLLRFSISGAGCNPLCNYGRWSILTAEIMDRGEVFSAYFREPILLESYETFHPSFSFHVFEFEIRSCAIPFFNQTTSRRAWVVALERLMGRGF